MKAPQVLICHLASLVLSKKNIHSNSPGEPVQSFRASVARCHRLAEGWMLLETVHETSRWPPMTLFQHLPPDKLLSGLRTMNSYASPEQCTIRLVPLPLFPSALAAKKMKPKFPPTFHRACSILQNAS